MTVPQLNETINTKVVGTTHQLIDWSLLSEYMPLQPIREPDNPYDENAIAIYTMPIDGVGHQLGYLSKELAADLAPKIDEGKIDLKIIITDLTGGGDKYRGINIKIIAKYKDVSHLLELNPFQKGV